VITKDNDFYVGHLLEQSPRSLLIVVTGNIANSALITLFEKHLEEMVTMLNECSVVELGHNRLVGHADRKTGDQGDW
jgi:predicted nuclease of predicted toxin-antitoxin system